MGLEWSEIRLVRALKARDSKLFVLKTPRGMLQVYREPEKSDPFALMPDPDGSIPTPMLVFCLTDNWKLDGRPVKWGLEPIFQQLRSMDNWGSAMSYETMVENRERVEADLKRQQKNEFRAKAADMRRDFAKATNDINTSSLDRRINHGIN